MFCRKGGNADDKGITLKYGIIGIIRVIFIFAMLVSVSVSASTNRKLDGNDYCMDTVSMKDEIIGRCDTCARIDIDDITIVYWDGTSETGYFGSYFRK